MTKTTETETEWVLWYELRFKDGAPEGALLHRGTEAECERLSEMLPAVGYSGSRAVRSAAMVWAPVERSPFRADGEVNDD